MWQQFMSFTLPASLILTCAKVLHSQQLWHKRIFRYSGEMVVAINTTGSSSDDTDEL